LALVPGAAKKSPRLDDNDVALTRARTEIAELQVRAARIETNFEVLERRILSLEAREAMPQRLTMTQHEYVEQQRASDRYSAFAQHQMQAQGVGMQQGMAQQNMFQNGLSQDYEAYIRNCTPGRAEVLRRQG
jgi:hypothetical protein